MVPSRMMPPPAMSCFIPWLLEPGLSLPYPSRRLTTPHTPRPAPRATTSVCKVVIAEVKNAFSLDQLINRRRRPGLSEACEVYEVDVSDTGPVSEDEDILNYDDVDDPDAYV